MFENLYLDIIMTLITGGFALYLNSFRKSINSIKELVNVLSGKLDLLDKSVKDHAITIAEITMCENVMSRIDIKIKQSLDYIDPDDIFIKSFIQRQGEMAKECIEWAIHNKLKVTESEIKAKYESCNIEVRDLLVKSGSDFSQRVRPELIQIVQHHVDRVIAIATDELFNSKLDRFFTLTEQTVNEVISTIVKAHIELKIKNRNNAV